VRSLLEKVEVFDKRKRE